MKAFSFLTILESLSKKLSILRTKMHSDNLRVDYESITSQLRVSRPFSRTSFGASFTLSRRVSHFAAILTILFTVGVGNVFAQKYSSTPLVDLDFSSSLPEVSGVTYNGASYSGGYISWSGNYKKALSIFRKTADGHPNHAISQYCAAKACAGLGDLTTARYYFERYRTALQNKTVWKEYVQTYSLPTQIEVFLQEEQHGKLS